MAKHNDEFYTLIKDYAEKQKTLTEDEAASMLKRWADIQVEVSKTRQKYIPLVEKVISAPRRRRTFSRSIRVCMH